jgi:hypothetical protein
LRGLAAVLMVQQHLGVWLVNSYRYAAQLRAGFVYVNMAGGLAAPLFIVLSGVSSELASQRAGAAAVSRRRGALLVGFGFVLNLLVPSWFSWASFYVLHLLGVWLMLAPSLRHLKSVQLWGLALLALVLGVLGQTWLSTPVKLTNAMMRDWERPWGPLRLLAFEGQFPIFPGIALALGGAAAGRLVAKCDVRALWVGAAACAVCAAALRGLVLVVDDAATALPWRALCRTSFFPLSSLFALLLFALCMLLLAITVTVERAQRVGWFKWLVPLGRTSLSLLFVHVVCFREGLTATGFMGTQSPLVALSVIVLFLSAWYQLSRRWARVGYRYGLEWWLRRAAPFSQASQ